MSRGSSNRSIIGSVVQSLFEEIEELHQLVPLDSTSEAVEVTLIHAHTYTILGTVC
jgi:hypothetical protein